MKKEKGNTQGIKKTLARTVLWSVTVVFAVLALAVIALQLPYVQTRIVQKLSRTVTEKTGFASSIRRVHIKWFDTMVFDSVLVLDQQQREMIMVEQLSVDFNISSFLDVRDIQLDEARIRGAQVHLYKDTVDNTLNMTDFVMAIKELTKSKHPNPNRPPAVFRIDKVQLRQADFSFFDPGKPFLTDQFDYNHFELKQINGDIEDLRTVSDTFDINIKRMTAVEPVHDFTIHDFTGFYRMTDETMVFSHFNLYAGNTTLRDSVVLHYKDKSALSYFNDSVTIVANIDKTKIHSKDLSLFAPSLKRYNEFYAVSGKFKGKVVSFSVKDFIFDFGAQSHLMGDVNFDGLPNFKETFIDLDLKRSVVDVRDLEQYIDNPKAYQDAQLFGTVRFNGEFVGFPNDFVANGAFDTQLGGIVSDINLKLEGKLPEYSGKLALRDFDLGTISKRPDLLQNTTFKGQISGKGITLEDADVNLKATFKYLGVNHYNFTNIQTDARLGAAFFEGNLSIHDPNLKLEASGTVDLQDDKEDVVLDVKLDTAFLQAIHLTKEFAFVSTTMQTNTHGLTIDSIAGTAWFHDLYVRYQDQQLLLDSLQIASYSHQDQRTFEIESSQFEALIKGNYQFSTLTEDIKTLLKEYKLIFSNDEEALKAYFAKKTPKPVSAYEGEDYTLDYQMTLTDINPLLHLFLPDISISPDTRLEGNITGGYTHIFTLNSRIDTLQYRDSYFYDNTIDISTSKIADSTEVLAMVYLHSDKQDIRQKAVSVQTENLVAEAIWSEDHIDIQQSVQQQNTSNHASLAGNLLFLPDSTLLRLNTSDIQLLDRSWSVSGKNRILFTNHEVYVDSLSFFNRLPSGQSQEIAANGILSVDSSKQLTIRIDSFLVDNLNPLLSRNYQGTVNGFVDIKNFMNDPDDSLSNLMLNSEILVQNFTIDEFLVGDLVGLANWNNQKSYLDLNMMVNRLGRRMISMQGSYNPSEDQEQLNLRASFKDAQINIIEPYIDSYFSNLGGTIDANVTLTGRLDYPVLKGSGKLKEGKAKINYLNTDYFFNSDLVFDENAISVSQLLLTDNRNQQAVFNGGIFHDGFRDFLLDLKGDLANITVLNTALKDNDLFYGKGYATGKVTLFGAINHLDISARLKTEKGTKLFIPIGGIEGIEQSEFISFVTKDSTTQESVGKTKLTGLNLDLEIEVTPDAYGEIIFDPKTGDIIRGRGNGQLQFLVTSEGDFNMFGDFQFTEGGYNFTLYNIINKEFKIEPGSSIAWQGDPYGGILNIKASYEQLASLAPLVVNDIAKESDDVQRKYKTEVLLKLTGDLMSPDINYDINVDNYPENNIDLRTAVESLKSNIGLDTEELKRQVFSLIVLRKFSERGSFDGSNAVSGSVSEFLSNQFSYWFSQVDENLEIDVDLGSFDDDRFNTFQLRLSYTLFDGRLRITRNGGFTNANNQTSTASVIGDVTVEYLLTKDGKYRVKMYNRSNFNSLNQRLNIASTTTQGISLEYVESFDKVKELFSDTRNRAIRQKKDIFKDQRVEEETPASQSTEAPNVLGATKKP